MRRPPFPKRYEPVMLHADGFSSHHRGFSAGAHLLVDPQQLIDPMRAGVPCLDDVQGVARDPVA